ncbi:polymorphic toxin-type HINT domain-containing protein [Streptomyces sp. NPDC046866]|uniref:polymorphic toxin-type HINT domain-containing protein n=1 Tax=Streptomyces sp. NPDC046866 TaxID=3154921 RepID=UPI003454DAD8
MLPSAAVAAEGKNGPPLPALKQPKAVKVTKVATGGAKRRDAAAENSKNKQKTKASWPSAGSAEVSLATGGQAGRLPVVLSPAAAGLSKSVLLKSSPAVGITDPGRVKVAVADHGAARKAGIDGVLLSLARTDGAARTVPAEVEVDYSSFRQAYGGDYAARLHLVELPACALTTPERAECRTQKPLQTKNDTRAGKLSAKVDTAGAPAAAAKTGKGPQSAPAAATAGATVLAATAGASGPTGDYKATSLQPSGSWNAGGSTGAFSWSYGIGVPTVPGGLDPKISLAYSSQSVDGRTSASNTQASWIGDGWSWEPGFIERKYKSCEDDKTGGTNTTKVGDLCWFNDNATLSLGGKSTELVYEKDKGWHPASDSGEKVEKLTGASNGDNDGEHWRVTTIDGTQYYFGLNRLPGWKDASTPTTNSAWTVPVFGNQSGEPCYNSSFASGWCQQAWRWQLDYVVAPGGDAMAYYWKTETNNYGRNVSSTTGKATVTPYIRGGWLDHIDYGLRNDSVYTAKAMGQVTFDVSERCLNSCGTFDEANAKNWPDSPFDLFCKDGSTECKDQYSPTFWSRMRLTGINTKMLTGGAYQDVDSWALEQSFPPSGDGISTPMWLKSIKRTGKAGAGADVPLPPVTFAGEQRPNRVDKTGDGLAPFIRLRMYQVTTETGGTIGVTYSQPDCTDTTLPKPDETNTTRCYPVKWVFEGDTAKLDWFNSYVVTQVVEGDNLADSPDKVTSYDYLGGAAWAKSTDEFTKSENRVHSVARGYERVQTRTGAANDAKSLSETRYFRGLDGKEVKDSAGVAVIDREEFAGTPRETATYNGDDTTKLVTATSTTPWRSAAVATRKRDGLPDLVSYKTGTEKQSTRTTVTGGVSTVESTSHFDEYGMIDSISETGDTAKAGDEKCTTTSYARNKDTWILNKVSRVETVAVACGAAVNRPADVVKDVRTYFDNGALGAVPGPGLTTKIETINAKGDGYDPVSSVPSTCGAAKNQLCYDIYGRQLASADPYGQITTTLYTPATGEAPTSLVVTNPKGHVTSSVIDPLRAQPLQATDANGKVTTTEYDALGRVTKVWAPNRAAATYPDAPSSSFDYLIRNDGPVVVTSKTLTHDYKYAVSYSIQDGLLRERQTQTQSPDLAGRLISETFYNTLGQAWRTSGVYYAEGTPTGQLVTGQEAAYPASADTLYDGVGRVTAVIAKKFGTETKRTTTTYTGDTTTVVPPEGGTPSTTVVDALGRTVELKQYTDPALTTSQSTLYAYDTAGRLAQVTDPSQAKWTYVYDVSGQQIESTDPDKGTTKTVYDVGGRPTDVTDARNITLHTDYDELGRVTATKQGTTTLTATVYDTVAKGQPTKSTRFVDGKAFESEVLSYNDLYQPLATKVTIPATPDTGALAGTYQWTNTYNISGQVLTTKQPAMGDLPAETVGSTYKSVSGLLNTMGAGSSRLVSAMTYDHFGRSTRQELGAAGQRLYRSTEYDEHTGAVTRAYTDRDVAPQRIEDTKYGYNPAGAITSIAAAYGQDTTRSTDTQCVNLDALNRITQAWTNKGETCAATPSATVIGGEDPYWTTYTYDAVGNRKTEAKHKTASGPTADTVRTYTPPTAGKHDLLKVTQTGTDPHEETFTYDASGNTKSRKTSGSAETQYLTWDVEGHLKSLDQGTSSSSFLYDTSGQRLLRKDSTGTTLYLPGGNELRLDKAGTVKATRYYGDVAMRENGKLTFLLSDHHGTGTTQITADTTQAVTRRKTGIFGEERGTKPTTWAGDKGFVGGTKDTDTGLTHLGAREYDPLIGRFVSVDPIMDLTKSQQMHGYVYSSNNPVSLTDPSGLQETDCYYGHCDGHLNPRDDKKDANDPTRKKPISGGYDNPHNNGRPTINDRYWLTPNLKPIPLPKKNVLKFIQIYRQNLNIQLKFTVEDSPEALWVAQTTAMLNACEKVDCRGEDLARVTMLNQEAKLASGDVAPYDIPGGSPGGIRLRDGLRENGKVRTGGSNCFLAGTAVLMADGTTKKIEEISVGDEVLAVDPRSGESGPHAVTQLIQSQGQRDLNELSIETPTGTEQLTATHDHPFWSPKDNSWIHAGDLTPGISLLTDEGEEVRITGNRAFTEYVKTYNFTVSGVHTYYVLAGKTAVLVHNSCEPIVANGASLEGMTVSEMTRIQNAANSRGVSIAVVGSRVKGPRSTSNPNGYHAESDWDYVITGINSRTKSRISSSLPKADVSLGRGRRQDIFTGQLVETEPYVMFHPQR